MKRAVIFMCFVVAIIICRSSWSFYWYFRRRRWRLGRQRHPICRRRGFPSRQRHRAGRRRWLPSRQRHLARLHRWFPIQSAFR